MIALVLKTVGKHWGMPVVPAGRSIPLHISTRSAFELREAAEVKLDNVRLGKPMLSSRCTSNERFSDFFRQPTEVPSHRLFLFLQLRQTAGSSLRRRGMFWCDFWWLNEVSHASLTSRYRESLSLFGNVLPHCSQPVHQNHGWTWEIRSMVDRHQRLRRQIEILMPPSRVRRPWHVQHLPLSSLDSNRHVLIFERWRFSSLVQYPATQIRQMQFCMK